MGAAENARAGAAEYCDEMGEITAHIQEAGGSIDQALTLISTEGPLGSSHNPNLMTARGELYFARQRAREAARDARASREPIQQFILLSFPA